MNKILLLIASILLCACQSFGDGGVDLTKLADQVALVRLDIADLRPLATADTQAKLVRLDASVQKVEAALRAAGAGGPISDVRSAAAVAFDLADVIVLELEASGHNVGNMRLYIGGFRIAFRHLEFGETKKAEEEIEETIEETTSP